ncbi:MAG TPA: choice-of-anchor tandem repeat GloVer-containing protein [Terriglobales bacterium]|nr:choice-of-anchor tandem repeat GloVer-containing protein [Terriglobales bacterium]
MKPLREGKVMHMRTEQTNWRVRGIDFWVTIAVMTIAVLMIAHGSEAHAQTYTVIHNFTGCADGDFPTSTLIWDRAGNLYGSTELGGVHCTYDNDGVVFQLKHNQAGWTLRPLQEFVFTDDNISYPLDYGGLTFGPDGNLYGTTKQGGPSNYGIVFRLQPPPRVCTSVLCLWSRTILYEFSGAPDGGYPESNVIFDGAGNLYGTTANGVAYELTPAGGGWNEQVIPYNGGTSAGLVIDSAGNLYGVGVAGSHGHGGVFELSPSPSGWTETVLYNFTGGSDGTTPVGGLIFDRAGNLYGSTSHGGSGGGGTIFELSPSAGGWTLNTLCSFAGNAQNFGPQSPLTMDAAGNLYGTTMSDGHGAGTIFKATNSGGVWTCTDLYKFQFGPDGGFPIGGVTLDNDGNLYGTASEGGAYSAGVVWEITP